MLSKYLEMVRKNSPLIHNITNYVTVNDCANILLAVGASPVMADEITEVEEITTISTALNLNIGTLNQRTIESMLVAGKKANELNHPVLLDPVGVGASSLRTATAKKIIGEVKLKVIRGNSSELKALFMNEVKTKGVDASEIDEVNEENLNQVVALVKEFSLASNSVIVVSGKIDVISDGITTYVVRNGVKEMAGITGSGCMLSALTTAFIGVSDDLEAIVASVCLMGICGELALVRMVRNNAGNSSFRNYLIDAISNFNSSALDKCAKYELK